MSRTLCILQTPDVRVDLFFKVERIFKICNWCIMQWGVDVNISLQSQIIYTELLSVTTTLNFSALLNSNFKIVADIVRVVADYIVSDAQISILWPEIERYSTYYDILWSKIVSYFQGFSRYFSQIRINFKFHDPDAQRYS